MVFGSRHFQVCRALSFAVHPPPAGAQDAAAGSLALPEVSATRSALQAKETPTH